jgi:hypothetical protein
LFLASIFLPFVPYCVEGSVPGQELWKADWGQPLDAFTIAPNRERNEAVAVSKNCDSVANFDFKSKWHIRLRDSRVLDYLM